VFVVLQIDRINFKNRNKSYNVKIGKSTFSSEYIDSNSKLIDFKEGVPCPICHMRKDIAEEGVCSYCLGVLEGL
jgi:hypothetical protein